MQHYVCHGGCHGESEQPGTCQADSCPKHNQPLDECGCEDGQHGESQSEAPQQE